MSCSFGEPPYDAPLQPSNDLTGAKDGPVNSQYSSGYVINGHAPLPSMLDLSSISST